MKYVFSADDLASILVAIIEDRSMFPLPENREVNLGWYKAANADDNTITVTITES